MNESGNDNQDGFFIRDFGKQEYFNGFKKNDEKQEKNDNLDLEILKKSGIVGLLEELRDSGEIRWSDKKSGSLPTIRDPNGNLESTFVEPDGEKEVDYEPARIYMSTDKNNVFVSFLFNGSKEINDNGTYSIKCSESRFGIRDRKLCSIGFGTSAKPLNNNIIDGIVDAIVKPNFKGIYLNKN